MDSFASDPISRPSFAAWLFHRDLTFRDVAKPRGPIPCSHEQLRRICLPFHDENRRKPSAEVLAAITALTKGECGPPSFEAPAEVRPGDLSVLQAGRAE